MFPQTAAAGEGLHFQLHKIVAYRIARTGKHPLTYKTCMRRFMARATATNEGYLGAIPM